MNNFISGIDAKKITELKNSGFSLQEELKKLKEYKEANYSSMNWMARSRVEERINYLENQ